MKSQVKKSQMPLYPSADILDVSTCKVDPKFQFIGSFFHADVYLFQEGELSIAIVQSEKEGDYWTSALAHLYLIPIDNELFPVSPLVRPSPALIALLALAHDVSFTIANRNRK